MEDSWSESHDSANDSESLCSTGTNRVKIGENKNHTSTDMDIECPDRKSLQQTDVGQKCPEIADKNQLMTGHGYGHGQCRPSTSALNN